MARRPGPRALTALVLAALLPLVLVLPGAINSPTAAAPAPVYAAPALPRLPAAVDAFAEYQGQVICSPTAKPGARKLSALLQSTYGSVAVGVTRPCSDGGTSEHKEGRALDWMVGKSAAGKARAKAFLTWLLAKAADGQAAQMARRLGVMYIGWDNRMWRAYDPAGGPKKDGWSELKGCYDKPSASYDTYCHRDHVHLSLSWDGAAARTSGYDGTAETRQACPKPYSAVRAVARKAGDVVAVTPAKVLDTRTGLGVDGSTACRLGADRWDGDGRTLRVPVLGRAGVPASGVEAVLVRVSGVASNAPSALRVGQPGTAVAAATTSVAPARNALATTLVPVGSDGSIAVSTSVGSTDLAVFVLGYVASPTVTSAGAGGRFLATAPTRAAALTLAGGATTTVRLAGRGGLPTTGLASVVLSVEAKGVSGTGTVRVWRAERGRPDPGTLAYRRNAVTGLRVVTPTGPTGEVKVRNTGRGAVQISIDSQGGGLLAARPAGGALQAKKAALLIDTARRVGIAAVPAPGTVATVQVAGRAGVPVGTRAVVLQVATAGSPKIGSLRLWAAGGATPTGISVLVGPARSDLVVAPLSADGKLAVRFDGTSAALTAQVLGIVR